MQIRKPSLLPAIFLSLALSVLAGCVPPSSIKPVESVDQLPAGKVIVVGQVELVPALAQDEQLLDESYEEFRNSALLITDTELRNPEPTLTIGGIRRSINADMGSPFFVAHDTQPFFILKSWVVMDARIQMVAPNTVVRPGNAPLHGVFGVDIQATDQAVYIGTLRYHRDDFFSTEKVEVLDNFTQANIAFTEKFGEGITLRKSLAVPLTSE